MDIRCPSPTLQHTGNKITYSPSDDHHLQVQLSVTPARVNQLKGRSRPLWKFCSAIVMGTFATPLRALPNVELRK
jgi:hypothetical protein